MAQHSVCAIEGDPAPFGQELGPFRQRVNCVKIITKKMDPVIF